ncbi:MAG: TIM barrel protein [Thermoguttaceae bacterium]|jgi:hydroxypyruvate isomerase
MTRLEDLLGLGRCRVTRRAMLQGVAGAAGVAAAGSLLPAPRAAAAGKLKGRIHQSVCLWCYGGYMQKAKLSLDQFAEACAKMGLLSIELTGPDQWPTLKKHGLICAMSGSHGIGKGFNRVENHEECLAAVRRSIDATAAAGFPNVICFSGNRAGMDDQEGLKNSIAGVKKIAGYAEQKKITVCLEFLNSHDHGDYMADSTKWCVAFVEGVGSPRVKVLYDIYHAGMMKEDVLADVQKHADCWGHYHTGGVPGRHEIDKTQTIDYPQVMRAIADSGYTGYVGQEFIPARPDAMASLEQAVTLCDV